VSTIVSCKSAKITIPIPDGTFPREVVPPKGSPGSASSKVTIVLRLQDVGDINCLLSGKTLQRAFEAAAASPGGHWVVQGRLGPNATLIDAGVVYQAPAAKEAAAAA